MFDQLFKCPIAVARYHTRPLLKERLAYLRRVASRGYVRTTLRSTAQHQLAILKLLKFARRPHKTVTLDEIKRKARNRQALYTTAVRWLRFMGRLKKPCVLTPCAKKIRAFADYMEIDKGLSPVTI